MRGVCTLLHTFYNAQQTLNIDGERMPAAAATADAFVGVRIPRTMKENVAAVADRAGLNISDLLRMFLKRVDDDGRLPFDPFEERTPNAKTLAAMREAEEIKHARFSDPEEMFRELDKAALAYKQAHEAAA